VADIVLREDVLPPARVRVIAELAQALVQVLDGEVRLGEQTLAAGAHAAWPAHSPMQIGSSLVAYGLACKDEWALPAPAAGADASAPAAQRPRTPLRKRAEVWLAATGAAVLIACGGSLWMAHVAAQTGTTQSSAPPTLAAALKGSEFTSLEAIQRQDGSVELRGRLASLAQRTRLDAWLAAGGYTPKVEVVVDEELARSVAEVFRVNGVPVRVQVAGPGRIVAEAAERNVQRLAQAEDVVRRDVRGLDKLTVRNDAPPAPPAPATPLSDDPNKRIASIVPGEPAYVVTADGARYFVGAILPSGHRITQVAAQRVTLERDGQQTSLNF
jgi:type III secretion protein D